MTTDTKIEKFIVLMQKNPDKGALNMYDAGLTLTEIIDFVYERKKNDPLRKKLTKAVFALNVSV